MEDRPQRRGLLSGDLESPDRHAFVRHPHRTIVRLSLPVLISLVAEPLTGLADTAFVARLGAAPLAALGVGTALLSSVFWIFNFLGIGTQTEVAHALGTAGDGHGQAPQARAARQSRAERGGPGFARAGTTGRDVTGLALALAVAIGAGLALLSWPCLGPAARFMSNDEAIQRGAVVYLQIRLLSAPAVLVAVAAFGSLRGLQDMRTPLWIALATNALNVLLDPLLIFGAGPLPALGIAGAAWATVIAQWLGAFAAFAAVRRRPGLPPRIHWHDVGGLLVVGRDLFLRTGLLLSFMLLTTRAATHIGVDGGAAHQAIRQVWIFTALVLDAYAASAQSLVGYFLGAERLALARRASRVASLWALGTGAVLALAMAAGEGIVALLLVPESARPVFEAAWVAAALAQPMNALSFATDGILWGARDYRYLRNAMFAATVLAGALVFAIDLGAPGALARIWVVTAVWIALRTAFGIGRIWPGFGRSPLRRQ